MKIKKIKDNSGWGNSEPEEYRKDKFKSVFNLTNKIADKPLEELYNAGVFVFPDLKAAEDIKKYQKIIESSGENYCSGNLMGFLGYGDERLVIQSRFGGDNDYFIWYLLTKVFDFPNVVDFKTDASQDNRLFDYVLLSFPYYLKTAMRKGLYKKYIRRQYNDDNVRGIIDIARHIKINTPFIGKVAYSQREFSYDNALMELVRHTIEFIKGKAIGRGLLSRVSDEVKLVTAATPGYKMCDRRKIIELNKKNIVRHAYYREYRDLQRLCLLILLHEKNQMSSSGRKIYGILFDGSWLWEEYVNKLIGEWFHHPMNRIKEGCQQLFAGEDRPEGRIYPDFIGKDSVNRIIADAKYKPIGNIVGDDYLQILAYMFRFDAKTGYFLYPGQGESQDKELRLNSGSTYDKVKARDDVKVIKHCLKIPEEKEGEDYKDFVSKMEIQESNFKQIFNP